MKKILDSKWFLVLIKVILTVLGIWGLWNWWIVEIYGIMSSGMGHPIGALFYLITLIYSFCIILLYLFLTFNNKGKVSVTLIFLISLFNIWLGWGRMTDSCYLEYLDLGKGPSSGMQVYSFKKDKVCIAIKGSHVGKWSVRGIKNIDHTTFKENNDGTFEDKICIYELVEDKFKCTKKK